MPPFEPGLAYQLSPLVRRITAPNSGPMTGPGTNTYLIGEQDVTVIDPGPLIETHINAIVEAGKGNIRRIMCTHTHSDHSPAAAPLAELTGATLIGAPPPNDPFNDQTFKPTTEPTHQQVFRTQEANIVALHTPGHVGNHFCFFLEEEGMVFAGDHIMNGSTVVIIPPSGDMKAYIESLRLLLNQPMVSIAPAHGDLMPNPVETIEWLVAHRLEREAKVLAGLNALGPSNLDRLVVKVYDDVDTSLHSWAKLSMKAHLLKLEAENVVKCSPSEVWSLVE
jgi:glyoxylase-like metal-dependent hydrolase (beta-lactamase superfamily II)